MLGLRRRTSKAVGIAALLAGVGALAACGGVTQFQGASALSVLGTPPAPPPAPKPSPPPPPPPPPPPAPPPLAQVVNQQIVISEKIQFALGSDAILPASNNVLSAVAQVFQQHPEIKKVEVAGHASADGPAAYNMQLSQLRAQSVVNWLVKNGVSKDILVAKGYGITKPLVQGMTPDALEKNRRVEFNILDPAQIADSAPPSPTPQTTPPASTATTVPPSPPANPH